MSVSDDDLEKLTRIQQLRESGAITDEEFATMKQSILNPAQQDEEHDTAPVTAAGVDVISEIFWKLPVDLDEAHRQIAAAAPSVGLKFGLVRDLDGSSGFLFRGKVVRHNMYRLMVSLTPNGPGTDVSFAVQIQGMVEISSYTRKLFEDVQKPLLAELQRAN